MNRRSFALGALTAWSASRVMGANERVRMGLIGSGGRGKQDWATFLKQPEVDPAAVCDLYDPFREKGVEMAGGKAKAFTDFRKLIDDKDIDAVIVAVPDHWHAIMTIAACDAGKDVYCEKPLSLTVVEGRRMVEAARRNRRVVQTGSQQRSGTHYAAAVKLIRDGGIGEVHRIRAGMQRNIFPGLQPTEMAKGADSHFRLGHVAGPRAAAAVRPVPLHLQFSLVLGLLGRADDQLGRASPGHRALDCGRRSAPSVVAGFGGRYALTDGGETPDLQEVTYQFGKTVVTWTVSEIAEGKGFTLDVFGTKGMLSLTRGGYTVTPEKTGKDKDGGDGTADDEGQRPRRGARPQLPRLREEPAKADGGRGGRPPLGGDVPPGQHIDAAGPLAQVGCGQGAGYRRLGGQWHARPSLSRAVEAGLSRGGDQDRGFTSASMVACAMG